MHLLLIIQAEREYHSPERASCSIEMKLVAGKKGPCRSSVMKQRDATFVVSANGPTRQHHVKAGSHLQA
ncbi:hypothetical protein [Bradyrhizobium sp. CCBAU 11386]|uniref:hypothetical protein n=1 Tax=Bradyrhizobium sp. CCBAU 11386 TaxID=1630837 RepID=UPI00230454E1|nr:hypothetical protein [Bradyrhizobium sp. CCBAU 11386]